MSKPATAQAREDTANECHATVLQSGRLSFLRPRRFVDAGNLAPSIENRESNRLGLSMIAVDSHRASQKLVQSASIAANLLVNEPTPVE
jgi:hypothetical protein